MDNRAAYLAYLAKTLGAGMDMGARPGIGTARPPGGTAGSPDVGGNRGQYEDGSPIAPQDPRIAMLIQFLQGQAGGR